MLGRIILVISGFLQMFIGFGLLYEEERKNDTFGIVIGWICVFLGTSLLIIAGRGM